MDPDNPNWGGQGKFTMRVGDLPAKVQTAIERLKTERASDGSIAFRMTLPPDIADALKATGPGWEERANQALREKFVNKAA